MRKQLTNQQTNTVRMKHESLVRSFLLYNYMKKSQREKDLYIEKVKPQIISRTMRLENEWVSEEDVRRIIANE